MIEKIILSARIVFRWLIDVFKFMQIPIRNRNGKVVGHVVRTMRGTVIFTSTDNENDQKPQI